MNELHLLFCNFYKKYFYTKRTYFAKRVSKLQEIISPWKQKFRQTEIRKNSIVLDFRKETSAVYVLEPRVLSATITIRAKVVRRL